MYCKFSICSCVNHNRNMKFFVLGLYQFQRIVLVELIRRREEYPTYRKILEVNDVFLSKDHVLPPTVGTRSRMIVALFLMRQMSATHIL